MIFAKIQSEEAILYICTLYCLILYFGNFFVKLSYCIIPVLNPHFEHIPSLTPETLV